MYSPRSSDPPADVAKKYDPSANQWMREAMESRHVIEELKAQNDKLQRDVYGLNSRMNLIYECLGDLNMTDRVGDLMQRKIRDFQLAQHAKQNPPPSVAFNNSPRPRRLSDAPMQDDGVICGSASFHQTAGFSSSYEGQIARDTFNRRNMFETEEAQYREKFDIFGNAKLPSPKGNPQSVQTRRGDSIDSLLSGGSSRQAQHQQPGLLAPKTYGSR